MKKDKDKDLANLERKILSILCRKGRYEKAITRNRRAVIVMTDTHFIIRVGDYMKDRRDYKHKKYKHLYDLLNAWFYRVGYFDTFYWEIRSHA